MDRLRSQLDELLGTERNVPLSQRKKVQEHYDDPEVCKYTLVSVCPHDLFPNTKCDLGPCPKRHEDFYKKMFLEDEARYDKEKKYINETINLFENLLHGIDSKIKKAQQKLDQTFASTEQPKELQEKLDAIDEEIKKLLSQVEELGDEGKIEESEACIIQVDALKKRKEEMKLIGDPNSGSGSRQMKVCEICGAMQAMNDTEKRSQAHYEGKLHSGFAILRKELEALRKRRDELRNMALISRKEKEKEERRERDEKDGDDKHRKRHSRSGSKGRKRRSRSRSGSKDRKRRDRDREKDRDRDGDRDRERDRDRNRGDRNDRDKDRERDRDRDRDREKGKDRDRDRERDRDRRDKKDKYKRRSRS